ncbi:g8236 [Coccomyxa viridis]|uniref:G8236 protein n=1 Tax=Coccomyxa viridis TaxID=1274662 RepID=A0ABP1FZV2_9CHLO
MPCEIDLGEDGESFAFIYSIENPKGTSLRRGVGAQIMGPGDSYLLQYSRNIERFWATPYSLALGATFRARQESGLAPPPRQLVTKEAFSRDVKEGFQASSTWHQGHIIAEGAGASGDLPSTVQSADWAFRIDPQDGWGPRSGKQAATAGWLASLPVFEPHWQVLMAKGTATGSIDWGGKRYDFKDALAYAEKNWGAGFPKKWWWIVSSSFENEPDASLTAVGARRGILQLPGVEEDVGMIGIHWHGQFIEMVPWNGEVQWDVEPWGSWRVWARNEDYEGLVEATCDSPGTPLRAPTADRGLDVYCRDSFFGKVRVRVWRRDANGSRQPQAFIDLTSKQGAVEVGGGPWWSTWSAQAKMQEPLKSLVSLPVDVDWLASSLPSQLRPPGL